MDYLLIYFFHFTFIRFIELALLSFLTLTLLQKLDILDSNLIEIFLIPFPSIEDSLTRQFLFSQISITFMILSLFSLIVNLKKEKVLGTSIYKIIFAKSILGNIIFINCVEFSLLFLNIYLYINKASSDVILYVFFITLILLTLFITRIILYSNWENLTMQKIASIYMWENKKLVKKPKLFGQPTIHSKFLHDLNEDTIEKILRKDVEYKRNFHVYQIISNWSLIKYKSKIQENYIEISCQPDIIIMWNNAIEALTENELYSNAIRQHNQMLNILISNEVYLSSFEINKILEKIFTSISAKEDKLIFTQNKKALLTSIELTMKYGFYKLNNDFTYTRLGKLNRVSLAPLYGNFMNDYYNLIEKSLKLSDAEKSKCIKDYFEGIRLIALNSDYIPTLELKYYEIEQILKEFNDEDVPLIGIPLSNLLHSIIHEDKKNRLLYFLVDFNHKSIYFATIIVASRLAAVYVQTKETEEIYKKLIGEYLMLLLAKLVELDKRKFKYYCGTVKNLMNPHKWFYTDVDFTREDMEFLSIIKQTIMIRNNKIDVKSISLSDDRLREIVNLFTTEYNSQLIDHKVREANKEYNDKFGILRDSLK